MRRRSCTRTVSTGRCSSRPPTSCSPTRLSLRGTSDEAIPRRSEMKALVLRAPNTAFELEQVPDPVAGPGEAVARVLACGSGLTIQHVKAGRIAATFPRIIGHEITGEIVQVGAGVTAVG